MIPRTVNVNGVLYHVKSVPASRIAGDVGRCEKEATLILLAEEASTAAKRSTYLHEVGHAAFFESGMQEIVKDFTTQPDRLEEILMQVFAPVYRIALGVK